MSTSATTIGADGTQMSPSFADLTEVKLMAAVAAILSIGAAVLTGCGDDGPKGPVSVSVWAHDGTDAERAVLQRQVAAFNSEHPGIKIDLRLESEGSYNDMLQAAASGGRLPDVAEIDGPLLASYVYQGAVVPLDGLVDDFVLKAQLPSLQAQGEIDGRRYAVATFDSGLGLYADRKALTKAGVRWPHDAHDAWTADEFADALAKLARHDPDHKVLDLKLNYGTGEWLTYGFAPLVTAAGGSLIDPETFATRGHLDAPPAIKALGEIKKWSAYVDPNADDRSFPVRRVALSWVGHWAYPDYSKALGSDLLVLPLPDLGNGSKTGQGSWTWTVMSRDTAQQRAAAEFLEFLTQDEQIEEMTAANGAVPGTHSSLQSSPLYAPDGPLSLFAEQLLATCGEGAPSPTCVAVPRPRTPGYTVLTTQFAQAVTSVLAGEDPATALRKASQYVTEDLAANSMFGRG